MTQRYGGIFSPLNSRDLTIIRDAEAHLMSDPDYALEDEEKEDIRDILEYWDEDNPYPGIEGLSIDELVEAIRGLLEQFNLQTSHVGSTQHYSRSLSEGERASSEEHTRTYRYWTSQLQKVLRKLRNFQRKLDNGDLD